MQRLHPISSHRANPIQVTAFPHVSKTNEQHRKERVYWWAKVTGRASEGRIGKQLQGETC